LNEPRRQKKEKGKKKKKKQIPRPGRMAEMQPRHRRERGNGGRDSHKASKRDIKRVRENFTIEMNDGDGPSKRYWIVW